MRMIKKVFLGGTCNGSLWRDGFQKGLNIKYFNPVVKEWTEEAKIEEDKEKDRCKLAVYVITPKMKGFYSIAEVMDDCHNKKKKTYFCYLPEDEGLVFDPVQLKSLRAVGQLVEKAGGKWAKDLDELLNLLNSEE
jgi:hypothetical protein